jgi:hypothetical protein
MNGRRPHWSQMDFFTVSIDGRRRRDDVQDGWILNVSPGEFRPVVHFMIVAPVLSNVRDCLLVRVARVAKPWGQDTCELTTLRLEPDGNHTQFIRGSCCSTTSWLLRLDSNQQLSVNSLIFGLRTRGFFVPVARVGASCYLVFGKKLFTDCSLSCAEVSRRW